MKLNETEKKELYDKIRAHLVERRRLGGAGILPLISKVQQQKERILSFNDSFEVTSFVRNVIKELMPEPYGYSGKPNPNTETKGLLDKFLNELDRDFDRLNRDAEMSLLLEQFKHLQKIMQDIQKNLKMIENRQDNIEKMLLGSNVPEGRDFLRANASQSLLSHRSMFEKKK